MKVYAIILIALTSLANAEVICTSDRLSHLDPQQSSDYLQKQLASRLYRPLLGKSGIVTAKTNPQSNTWKLTLGSATFGDLPGFKKREVEALDVQYSLERYLKTSSKSLFESQTLIASKLNGFAKSVKSIRVSAPKEIEIVFENSVSAEALDSLLAPPVGYVIPRNYKLPLSDSFSLYPPTKNVKVTFTSTSLDSKGEDEFSLRFVGGSERNAAGMKKLNCKRLYFPTAEMILAANEKKLNAASVKASQTKFFFRKNPNFSLTKSEFAKLSVSLNPGYMKLTDMKSIPGDGFIQKKAKALAMKKDTRPVSREAYLPYCDSPQLVGSRTTHFTKGLSDAFVESTGTKINFYPFHCDQILTTQLQTPNVIGSIIGFTYASDAEFLRAFDCEKSTIKPFGFCLPSGKLTKEAVEAEVVKGQVIIPITNLNNEFLEFF